MSCEPMWGRVGIPYLQIPVPEQKVGLAQVSPKVEQSLSGSNRDPVFALLRGGTFCQPEPSQVPGQGGNCP